MRFTVPQFIEHEAKIVGPLTFRQFVFVGAAGAACFVCYLYFGKTNFFLFIVASVTLIGLALALAFLRVGGRELPTILGNFFRFNLMPKIYIWKKVEAPIKFYKKEERAEEKKEEEAPLKIAGNSQLKKIRTQIEIKTK